MKKDEYASASGHGKYRRVEVRRVVNAPIQRVWDAITNADEVGQWWAEGVIEPREGGRIKLGLDTTECEGLDLDGIVKVWLPPHIFEHTWHEQSDPAMGLVRWDLVELAEGETQITLTNLIPAEDEAPVIAGWQEIVGGLGTYLNEASLDASSAST